MRAATHRLIGAAALGALLVMVTGCSAAPGAARPQATGSDHDLSAMVAGVDADGFMASHPGLWVSVDPEEGFESVVVTSYDPMVMPPPERQESVSYGWLGSSPDTMVVPVYSVNVQVGQRYYVADFDASTKAKLFEEGVWPLDSDREAYITERLTLMDVALGR